MQFKVTSKYLLATLPLSMAMALGSCGGGDDKTTANPTTNLNPSSGSTTGTTTQPVKYQLTRAEVDYNGDGSIDHVYKYASDANGNLIRWESYDNSGKLSAVSTFTYDANKKLVKQAWDSTGQVGSKQVSVDGVIDGVVEYAYDSHGNITREYTKNDLFSSTDNTSYTNKYSANGQLTQQQTDYKSDGVIDGVENYTYDVNGRLVKKEGNSYSTTYSYDAKGRLTNKKTVYSDNSPAYSETYTYNANGKVEKYQRSGGVSDVENYSFTYTYDGNGNATEERMYDGSSKLSAITRYSWQSGNGYTDFYAAVDPCLLVNRDKSPEERLFDSVFTQ